MKKIREYFMELDIDKSGMISPQEIEETLISFGLCKTKEDVESFVSELDTDGFGELDFEKFLHLLKEASLQNGKCNYLVDRNVLGEKNVRAKSRDYTLKLPSLTHKASERSIDFNQEKFIRKLRTTDKGLDMKEKDPKVIEMKKKIEQQKIQKRNKSFGDTGRSEMNADLSSRFETSKYHDNTSLQHTKSISGTESRNESSQNLGLTQRSGRVKYRNAKEDICTFFKNLIDVKPKKRSKSNELKMQNIPF